MNARLVVMVAMSTLPVSTPLDHTPAPAKNPQEMEKHVSIHSQVWNKDIALSGKTKKFQNIFEQSWKYTQSLYQLKFLKWKFPSNALLIEDSQTLERNKWAKFLINLWFL